MSLHWYPTLLSSPHTLIGSLAIAAAYLDAILQCKTERIETLALRQEVMHYIDHNLPNPNKQVADLNIMAVTELVISEIIAGHTISVKSHETGLKAMIAKRGGLNQLGVGGYLAQVICWCISGSSILREEKTADIFLKHLAVTSSWRGAASKKLPESPLYRPQREFETLKSARHCSRITVELLEDVHCMVELFFQPVRLGSDPYLADYADSNPTDNTTDS